MAMENILSESDIKIIILQLAKSTDEEIAAFLDLPVNVVHDKIEEITAAGAIRKSKSQTLLLKPVKVKKEVRVKQKKEVPVKVVKERRISEAVLYHEHRRRQMDRQKLPTRAVDYTQLRSVRIDDKTTIFLKPGEDINKARMAYLDRERPNARDYKGEGGNGKDLNRDLGIRGRKLNPQFVAEMMGFPLNWTELPFLSGEKKA